MVPPAPMTLFSSAHLQFPSACFSFSLAFSLQSVTGFCMLSISYSPAQEVFTDRFSEMRVVRYNNINLIGTNRALQLSAELADFSQDDKTYRVFHDFRA